MMEASTLLLIASLGSIAVLLLLYVYIFMFERRIFFGAVVCRLVDHCLKLFT